MPQQPALRSTSLENSQWRAEEQVSRPVMETVKQTESNTWLWEASVQLTSLSDFDCPVLSPSSLHPVLKYTGHLRAAGDTTPVQLFPVELWSLVETPSFSFDDIPAQSPPSNQRNPLLIASVPTA